MLKIIKIFVVVVSMVMVAPCHADQWAITFNTAGHDSIRSVYETPDGKFIWVGWFGQDAWIVKVDGNANVIWQKKYGSGANDGCETFLPTSDGGYICGGQTWGGPAGSVDWWIFKLNPDLSVAWQKTYGGGSTDWFSEIGETMDGGYIVTGDTFSFGTGNDTAWVIRLDAAGNIIWEKTYGGLVDDEAPANYPTTDGGYIVLAQTTSFGAGGRDIWVLKHNATGSIEWQKTYGGSGNEYCHSIRQTADEGYVIAAGTTSFGAGDYDLMVLKLDSHGNIEWQKAYGGPDHEGGEYHIRQTSEGGYIAVVETRSFGLGCTDILLLKLNADGSIAWQKTYGGSGCDGAVAIQQTNDDGYIFGGTTDGFGADFIDWFALKADENGDIPGCEYISDVSVTVTDTNAIVQDTNVVPQDSSAIVTDTNVVPQDTNIEPNTICYFSDLQLVNSLVTFDPDPSTFKFDPGTADCQTGAVGKFTFDATLTNISEKELSDLHVEVDELANDNLLLTENGLMGEGGQFEVPKIDNYSDGYLSPDEYVDVPFIVCLQQKKPFRLFVNVLGAIGPLFNPKNEHYYQLVEVSSGLNWHEAKDASAASEYKNLQGHLATLTSFDEETLVISNFPQIVPNYVWLGATDEAVEGDWKWITGEQWSYTNWDPGEPNGGTSENCLDYSDGVDKWNDESCSRPLNFYLLEYSAD